MCAQQATTCRGEPSAARSSSCRTWRAWTSARARIVPLCSVIAQLLLASLALPTGLARRKKANLQSVLGGLELSEEDLLRRQVILSLMCRMRVDWAELEGETGRQGLAAHFASEWEQLRPLADRGFCTLTDERLEVTPTGRLFLRHLAMVFDEYLAKRRAAGDGPRFSKTI